MSRSTKQPPQFHVGDWVSLLYGARRVVAQVIEDRGPLGVNRRRLYRIRVGGDQSEDDTFEVREEYLEAAANPDKNGREGITQ
jgi:hypothetical protein